MNRNTFLKMSALLVMGAPIFAQTGVTNPDPIGIGPAIDWINKTRHDFWHEETIRECQDDDYFHDVTYILTNTFGIENKTVVKDVNTLKKCRCKIVSAAGPLARTVGRADGPFSRVPSVGTGVGLQPKDECHSTGLGGEEEPNDNNSAANYGSGEGLNQSANPAGARTATSAASAFTLPYRLLGSGPRVTGTNGGTSPTCDTSKNASLFQVAHTDDSVTRYDICTGIPITTIAVPPLPLQIRVTPDGSQAIVTSYGSAISFINTATNQLAGVIQTDTTFTPSGLAISPDGSYALVTNYELPPDAYLAVVDIASQKVTRKILLDLEYPQSVFINPDATLAWVTFPFDNVVEVIDIMTGAMVQRIPFGSPFSVAFNLTGTVAYVAGGQAQGAVEVIDTKTYAVTKTIAVGGGATDLFVTPDGLEIATHSFFAKTVTEIDPVSLTTVVVSTAAGGVGAVQIPLK